MKTAVSNSRFFRGVILTLALVLVAGTIWTKPSAGQGPTLPEGAGKAELQKLCSQCHELEKSYSQKQDRAGWLRTIEKMTAAGMKASDSDLNLVTEYLVKNFGADEVPKVKVNKASAIELESGLTLRRSQANAVIQYREKNGAFKSLEDLKKVPGIDAAKLEEKKDRISFEQ